MIAMDMMHSLIRTFVGYGAPVEKDDVGPNKPRDHVEMTNAYTSESKIKFNLKGNAAEIRSTLDEAKK